jgi:hypothetical protein
MVTYTTNGREVRARKAYECEHCRGTISRGEKHWNYHLSMNGNWEGRRHFDCDAAWWQGDTVHMLSALRKLPGENPPDIDRVNVPPQSGHVLDLAGTGDIYLYTPQGYRARLIFAPNQEIAQEAVEQLQESLQLCLDSLIASSGDAKKSMQMSNFMQQMAQASGVEAKPRSY